MGCFTSRNNNSLPKPSEEAPPRDGIEQARHDLLLALNQGGMPGNRAADVEEAIEKLILAVVKELKR